MDCIEHTGHRDKDGYGIVGTRKYGTRRAHVVAWMKTHGAVPAGLLVCHRCDNPPCVNVEHLFLGTQLVNTRDKIDKGRANACPQNCTQHDHQTGRPRRQFDQEKLIELRRAGASYGVLCRELDLPKTTVARAVKELC